MFRQKRDNFIPLLSFKKCWLACKCYCIWVYWIWLCLWVADVCEEVRGGVSRSGGHQLWWPEHRQTAPIFIRVKYILKYTNRHIRKNCPLIISLASAPAEGTQSRRHHSNVNLGSMLNINLSFHHQPKHKQCILLHADILFPSSHLVTLLNLFTTDYYLIRGIISTTNQRHLRKDC